MDDVITLSDDDDIEMIGVVPATPKFEKRPTDSASTSATVIVHGGQPINFSDILPRNVLEISQQNNQPSVSNVKGRSRFSRLPPPLPTNIRKQFKQNMNPPKNVVRLPPSLIPRYQFEAYEGNEPKRRSKRCLEAKKSKMGKFVCTYDKFSCHKVIEGSVEFVNHMWQHVLKDTKRKPEEFRKIKIRNETDLLIIETAPKKKEVEKDFFLKQISTCQFCYATFSSIYLKQEHVSACHVHAHDPESTVCNICEMDLKSKQQLEAHLRSNHAVNDAPYACKQCSYRTSIRLYLFDHYAEKHTDDCLMCPFCIRQIPFRNNQKNREICFVEDFVHHVKSHTLIYQYRCQSCALSFSDVSNLNKHRSSDHAGIGNNYIIKQKPLTKPTEKPKISKQTEIKTLQAKFMKTIEGRRIEDEVACSSQVERSGYDTSTYGSRLHSCSCGSFKTYNGNRAASHMHRCKQQMKIIENHVKNDENVDESHELAIFSVNPPFSISEKMRKEKRAEKRRLLRLAAEKVKEKEILSEKLELPSIYDYGLLRLKFPQEELSALVEDVFQKYQKSRS